MKTRLNWVLLGSSAAGCADRLPRIPALAKVAVTPPPRADTMRITCPTCKAKAVITSRENKTDTVADLYCMCTNAKECGHTFVYTLGYSHTLNPPRASTLDLAARLINTLTPIERQQLLDLH
ncbi:ogr/Delta-like zinc finger family protein [Bowmanella denitrificans]|uniref:ogr/Delta-like zinc finger family protein n=1 Tax=Bowmanella denitrificans TaxID=366582 RepID=UPI001FE78FEB|nr:ogr/Delta-like zinc finger family protein [Bowmanella denitrificans]